MTIKSLIYFDKLHTEYLDIINSIKQLKNIEIINFICSLNTQLSISGISQYNGSLLNGIQQTKCDTVIVFSLTNDLIEIISKLSLVSHVYLILFPLSLSVSNLEKISTVSNVTVNTCLPLRYLSTVWKAYKELLSSSIFEPMQYIEAKFIDGVVKQKYSTYGSTLELDINLNNFYQLIMIDVVQFLSQRTIVKIQAFSKSFESEACCNVKNETFMHDYSVIIGHLKSNDCDIKKSPTSLSASSLLQPRTALIRIKGPTSKSGTMNFKIKIKSNAGFFVIDKNQFKLDGKEAETSGDASLIADDSSESFWSSALFYQGLERFINVVECTRQQGAPRLVDLGTQTDEESKIAKTSLIKLTELIQLCKVVSATVKAISLCQTCLVE